MRVVVIGATGNVGTSLLESLETEPQVQETVAVARRAPGRGFARTTCTAADIATPALVPILRGPDVPRLRVQAVHSLDVGDAYRRALVSDARGAFNVAADPPIGPVELGELLKARRVRLPGAALRAAAAATYALRLQPTEPGWVDMAFAVPLLDSGRARRERGWQPTRTA